MDVPCGPSQWDKASEDCKREGTQSPIDIPVEKACIQNVNRPPSCPQVHPNSTLMPFTLSHPQRTATGVPSCMGGLVVVDKTNVRVKLGVKMAKQAKMKC